jgi:hypothetical protein
MQIGKWRRQIVIPHVDACSDNPQTDKNQMRLPKNGTEGDMPLIAAVSGCDIAECFFRYIGIDDSEFVPNGPPPAPGQRGHVHLMQGYSHYSTVPGGYTWQQTYQFWQNAANLLHYDITFFGCECTPYDRDNPQGKVMPGPAYDAMHTYLNGGGRAFTTHYHYNWWSPPAGNPDFQAVAHWGGSHDGTQFAIDTSFPKGQAFAEWCQANGITQTLGQITLGDTRASVGQVATATQWIYDPTWKEAKYLSFNTPTNASSDKQCGRGVFTDVHLGANVAGGGVFPSECPAQTDAQHLTNQQALEFLFFDLSSCVQKDTDKPPPPPPK